LFLIHTNAGLGASSRPGREDREDKKPLSPQR
jgi:hypothetical protein